MKPTDTGEERESEGAPANPPGGTRRVPSGSSVGVETRSEGGPEARPEGGPEGGPEARHEARQEARHHEGGSEALHDGGSESRPEPTLTRVAMLLPVIGAPAGLLFAILASLMISGWHVEHSAIVQVDTLWRPGERVAMRVHVQAGDGVGIADARVRASLVRGEQSIALAELTDVTGSGSAQATVEAPGWSAGPAELVLDIAAPGHDFREIVPITLASSGAARRGTVTVSSSIKNWADDTEPQPDKLRIALRPVGRLAAGFENTLLVRITDPEGRPHVGPAEVRLLDGEFAAVRASSDAPRVVFAGTTDAQGLLRFEGQLSTDVVRFEVRALGGVAGDSTVAGDAKSGAVKGSDAAATGGAKSADATSGAVKGSDATATGDTKSADATSGDTKAAGDTKSAGGDGPSAGGDMKSAAGDTKSAGRDSKSVRDAAVSGAPDASIEPAPLGTRKFRLVSFAGAVRVTAEPLALRVGSGRESSLQITARALRAKKAVFIDLHGPGGTWIDTLTPVTGPELPRAWSATGLTPGFLQIEAYQFTTSPGESAALARVQLTEGDPDSDAALAPLFVEQRALLDVGRVEKGFDRELERKYLDVIEKAEVAAVDVPLARAWLLGTLPVEVLGPPLAVTTLPREQADVIARKQRWATGLRWFLLGGGGLFLLTTLLLIVISHRRAAARLTGEIHGEGATAAIAHEIAQAQRTVLLRAVALIVTMAMGLILTVVVLDKLLWNN